jgi:hypothetical protein
MWLHQMNAFVGWSENFGGGNEHWLERRSISHFVEPARQAGIVECQ